MGRDRQIEYEMSLKDEATAAYKKFVGEVEKGGIHIQDIAKGAGIALAGMFSVGAAVDFMKKAADADAGIQSLEQAMKNAGVTGEKYKIELLDQADALKKKTATDDDEIINLQKLVLSYTGNIEATRKLVPLILDVSRATGMSSDAAARLFSRTQEGSEGLKKLGITVGDTADEQQRLGEIVDQVSKKFGGQAEAFGQTDAGKIKSASIAWEDFEKSLGRLLNSTLIPMVPVLTNTANGLAGVAEELAKMAKGKSVETFGDTFVMAFYKMIGAEDAYLNKVVELSEKQSKANAQIEASGKIAPPAAAATKTFSEKLKDLNDQLKDLDPTSEKYLRVMTQIAAMEQKIALAKEKATNRAKGIDGTTQMDVQFSMNFTKDFEASGAASAKFFSDFEKQSKKAFGGDISPAELKRVEDQAALYAELRLKSYGEGKQRELLMLRDWEENAVQMASGNEEMITQIHQVAVDERAKIEREASQKTFEDIAGFAQQAIGLYEQSVNQASQAVIQTMEAQRDQELKGIDKARGAIKRKYDELLKNENLTAEQKSMLANQQAAEEQKLADEQARIQDQYDQQIKAEKTRAFEANKNAQVIASIINTAVEVTKVLATPWMIPIVAGLGIAQTALIASQPTPSFHTGGSGYFDAPPSQETMVKIRGGEKIDVYTPEQRDRMNGNAGVTIIFNNYSAFTDEVAVMDAIKKVLDQTGLPIHQAFSNKKNSVVLE